jgi:hypothetical protein
MTHSSGNYLCEFRSGPKPNVLHQRTVCASPLFRVLAGYQAQSSVGLCHDRHDGTAAIEDFVNSSVSDSENLHAGVGCGGPCDDYKSIGITQPVDA